MRYSPWPAGCLITFGRPLAFIWPALALILVVTCFGDNTESLLSGTILGAIHLVAFRVHAKPRLSIGLRRRNPVNHDVLPTSGRSCPCVALNNRAPTRAAPTVGVVVGGRFSGCC